MNIYNTIAALIRKMFPKSVDSAIASLMQTIEHLEAARTMHLDAVEITESAIDELIVTSGKHAEEANRAELIAARLRALVG